jgi:hypothetical protein
MRSAGAPGSTLTLCAPTRPGCGRPPQPGPCWTAPGPWTGPGRSPLWQEKLREDAIRATGREVLRFTYADYLSPNAWLARYREAMLRAYGPTPGS